MSTIETTDLSKTYPNGVTAVKNLSISVNRGEIFGFLGPNGAGKTTTVRLLNGMLNPTGGKFKILGGNSDLPDIRLRTATLGENAKMYGNLTVEENLRFFAALYDIPSDESKKRIEELLTRMQLWDKRNVKLGSFSTGMKKRAQLARTLLHNPEILFLDEPSAGLDPDSATQVTRLIKKLAQEHHTTVFLCTHNLPLAEEICDSFGFISEGTLIKSGKKDEIIDSVTDKLMLQISTANSVYEYEIENENNINTYIENLIKKGEHIRRVVIPKPSLEEAYFSYIGRSKHELA